MKRIVLRILTALVVIGCLLYIIPSFQKEYQNKNYSFDNLPSATNEFYKDLRLEIPVVTETFTYEIESVVALPNRNDWNTPVAKDQKTLEKRIEFFAGNNYEIKLINRDNKAVFIVQSTKNFGSYSTILTTSNSDFTVSAQSATTTTSTDANATLASKKLDLKRSDFGIAGIIPTQGENGVQFQVRLPVSGLLNPETLKLMSSNSSNPITVFVGGKEYQAAFLPNADNVITYLVFSPLDNVDDAAAIQTFLNTDGYNLGYTLVTSSKSTLHYGIWKLLGILTALIVLALVTNRISLNNISLRKITFIFSYIIIGLALTKFFAVTITVGYLLVFLTAVLLAIFAVRNTVFAVFGLTFIVLELLGAAQYLQLSWVGVLVLLLTSGLLWSTNYVKKIEKKYI